MSGENQSDVPERRLMVRYPAKASTTVIRETDVMRAGADAILHNVSSAGIGIVLKTSLQVNESVKIQLLNQVQRFQKETRGIVRHVTARDDGTYYVGIELSLRLTPLDVSLLRMGMARDEERGQQWW